MVKDGSSTAKYHLFSLFLNRYHHTIPYQIIDPKMKITRLVLSVCVVIVGLADSVGAFAQPVVSSSHALSRSVRYAKPRRLEENVDGPLFVNDRCINCAACSNFAPASFAREETRDAYHYVHQQPQTPAEMEQARAALAACPVAAIRLETKAERQHRAPSGESVTWTAEDEKVVKGLSIGGINKEPPFPRQFLGDMKDIYWMGHHNERSFGATPYLFKARHMGRDIWVMVDTPRFGASAQRAVESLTGTKGPDYLFLTHVDDTADHQKWVDHYPSLQRIFHAGDLGRHNWLGDKTLEDVEILLNKTPTKENGLTAYSLDGKELVDNWKDTYPEELVIVHTPGHSPGSITLYRKPTADGQPGVLFTGDSYGWTTRYGGRMTGMGRYGNNLRVQAETLKQLLDLDWQVIAPGHSHPRDYRSMSSLEAQKDAQRKELFTAVEDLLLPRL